MVEVDGICRGEGLEIGRPAQYRMFIRVRSERGGQELFDQPALRRTVGAHPSLFVNHVTFFVKLPHHRMQKAFRLQVSPQLQPVFRK